MPINTIYYVPAGKTPDFSRPTVWGYEDCTAGGTIPGFATALEAIDAIDQIDARDEVAEYWEQGEVLWVKMHSAVEEEERRAEEDRSSGDEAS